MVQIALLTPVANCPVDALRHRVGPVKTTVRSIGKPAGSSVDEILQAVVVELREGPRHLVGIHARAYRFASLCSWLE